MIFYKSIYKEDIKNNYIPGTVTTDIKEACVWFQKYSSVYKKKKKFSIKRNGEAIIIKFIFDENLIKSHLEFQKNGVSEHNRLNCWTSQYKTKAQINSPIENIQIINLNEFS
jgi:predicted transcriptional regulator